ncbi:MAG: catalase [Methylococcales bacterium]|nr:catalase [Methylococcales bacterium]
MPQENIPRCPFEHIPDPDLEDKQIDEIANIIVKLLDKRYPIPDELRHFQSENYPSSIQFLRGVHPKSHGCVKAIFEIDPNIGKNLQVGLFDKPGRKFDAIIRFSNATGVLTPDLEEDGKHNSRGMASKILDVRGKVITEDNGAKNQDFLMINQPVFAFANTEDYLRLERVLDTQNDKPDGFFAPLKLKDPTITEEQKRFILEYIKAENISEEDISRILESFKIVLKIKSPANPVINPLGAQYFSAAPFLFGPDRVMKFSAKPRKELPPAQMPAQPSENYLRETLIATMRNNEPIIFDFMLQIRGKADLNDLDKDIENACFEWNDPFIKVATITIPTPQAEVDMTENIEQCERLSFTPWHSLVGHQPIGGINRLRKSVYQASAKHRLEQDDQLDPRGSKKQKKLKS